MSIVQAGSLNTAALVVPGPYVVIQPPAVTLINGVATNVLGIVGTAQWGPANVPALVGNYSQYVQNFGQIQNRKFDMGTHVATAILQGANVIRCVRVTDGTDVAATLVAVATCITFTALYTGTLGNSISVTLAAGSKTSTFKAVVACPGLVTETFDNITGTGNAFWLALASAINNGQGTARGASAIITAVAGVGTTAAANAAYTLAGGTDGATTITASVLVGTDGIGAARKGMYALRATGCSVALLADADDNTQWTTQVAFGLSEGVYMIMTGPAGDTITNAVTAKGTAGIDSYAAKMMFGDWIYWSDPVNGLVRLVSPQGFMAGRLVNLGPHHSSLNKQLYGVVATQRSSVQGVYSQADLQLLGQNGFDLIANPSPGGAQVFSAQFGRNTSSSVVIHGDNYTRMTNFIGATINTGMGVFIGRLQSADVQRQAFVTLDQWFMSLWNQGMIGNSLGTQPWKITLDASNNLPSRVALGYMQADIQVQFLSVIEFLLLNVEGGQSVQISRTAVTQNIQ